MPGPQHGSSHGGASAHPLDSGSVVSVMAPALGPAPQGQATPGGFMYGPGSVVGNANEYFGAPGQGDWESHRVAAAAEDQALLSRLEQRQEALSRLTGMLGQLQETNDAEQAQGRSAMADAERARGDADRERSLRAEAEGARERASEECAGLRAEAER